MEFGVLGPLQVHLDGCPVDIGPPKQRLLLAVLLCRPGQAVCTDQLVDAIWGAEPPASATDNVYLYVHRLRKALGAERLTGRGRTGYALTVDAGELDAVVFAELVSAGKDALAGGDAATASHRLREARGLWRDRPFADLSDEPALFSEAARLTECHLGAIECHVDAELALGRHDDLVPELRRLTDRQPYRERLHTQLMLALYRCGRQTEALEVYQRVRKTLADELGLEPGAALRQMELAVLTGDPELDLETRRPSPAAPTADAGSGRPRAVAVPSQLPSAVTDFVGRTGYLDQLEILTRDGEIPAPVVVTSIAGMAGVGKTALALQWAHRARDRFPDGQIYIDLRGHAAGPAMRPIEALTLILRAVGVPGDQIPVGFDEACGLYRTTLHDRRLLILLDNAHDADQVRPLLPASPSMAVVTSRNRLTGLVARDGARRLSLDVFTPAESVALLTRMLGEPRARREAAALPALATACGYLPLALRIAAANLADEPTREIADYVTAFRTGRPLTSLEVADDRQASVRIAFELSYDTLKPHVRWLFRALSLQPGPYVTPHTAAALAGVTVQQAREMLGVLATAHLLRHPRPDQYGFHDLLRSYATDLAEREDARAERTAASRRLHDFYVHTLDAAAEILYPHHVRIPLPKPRSDQHPLTFATDGAAVAWLDAEIPNLVAVSQWAAQRSLPSAWLVADRLRGYFWIRRHPAEWLITAEAGLTAAAARDDLQGLAAAHLSLGLAHRGFPNYPEAVTHLDASLAASRRAAWPEAQAAALGSLAVISAEKGETTTAVDHFADALAINRSLDRRAGEAVVLGNLSTLRQMLGDLRQSVRDAIESLALYRETGSLGGEALMLTNLGYDYFYLGQFDRALDHLDRGLALHERIRDRYGQALAFVGLAQLHGEAGRYADGLERASAALTLAREIHDRRCEAHALIILAMIHQRLGDGQYALRRCAEALRVTREAEHEHAEVEALIGLAAAHTHLGRHDDALAAATDALRIAQARKYRMLEGQSLSVASAIHLAVGHLDPTLALGGTALASHRHTGYRLGEARNLVVLGHAHSKLNDTATAARCWTDALALFSDIGTPEAHEVAALLTDATAVVAPLS